MKYPNDLDDGWSYEPIKNTIETEKQKIKKLEFVLSQFPDAEIADFDGAPRGLPYSFAAESVKYQDDLIIGFSGDWCTLRVRFGYNLPFEDSIIEIYAKPHKFQVWDHPRAIYAVSDPYVTWNYIDKQLIEYGFDEKHIRTIFDELILRMASPNKPTNLAGQEVKIRITNPEEIHEYILNKIPFM